MKKTKMLDSYILRTPLIQYRDDALSAKIFLKPENLQIFGSYKIRGVTAVVRSASDYKLRQGLVTVSAGNMAQAVAFAARTLNIPCRVFVPDSAPQIKKTAIINLGAEVVEKPFSEIWEMVRQGDQYSLESPEFSVRSTPSIIAEKIRKAPSIAPFGPRTFPFAFQ
jgi:threonine dehydratase